MPGRAVSFFAKGTQARGAGVTLAGPGGSKQEFCVQTKAFCLDTANNSLHAEENAAQVDVVSIICVQQKTIKVGGMTPPVYALMSKPCGKIRPLRLASLS